MGCYHEHQRRGHVCNHLGYRGGIRDGVYGVDDMSSEERIEKNLMRILRAGVSSGSIGIIAMDDIDSMLKTMRDIMSESYIAGSNACHKAMKDDES